MRIDLVGAGIVGQAILKAHLDAGLEVWLSDVDKEQVSRAIQRLDLPSDRKGEIAQRGELFEVQFFGEKRSIDSPTIVIESIAEKLSIKQAFFQSASKHFGDNAILCSNTSTLRVGEFAIEHDIASRVCGMHFFMPVDQRPAVEIVRTQTTESNVIQHCINHAKRIGKRPIVVTDSPGFIVNRLLSPYLNQSLLLLAHGANHERIKRASLEFGMPLSPLELIDWIGTRTMFDAGRAFWQAFPSRLEPSPIVPKLIKRKRLGRTKGGGLYDYDNDKRSCELAAEAKTIVEEYALERMDFSDSELIDLLSVPMWIEARLAIQEGVAESADQIQEAMQGGLGYRNELGWNGFFAALGTKPNRNRDTKVVTNVQVDAIHLAKSAPDLRKLPSTCHL